MLLIALTGLFMIVTPTRCAVPRLPLLIGLVLLVAWAGLRAGLLAYTGIEQVPPQLWPRIFLRGLWFDLVVACVLLGPVCLYEAMLPNRWRSHGLHRTLRVLWLTLVLAVLLFGMVAEVTFWLEFATRFNFIAVDYLIYTQEVIGNIRQSYPVGWILAGIVAIAAGTAWWMRRGLAWADFAHLTRIQRAALVAAAALVPAVLLVAANVDQMGGSGNSYADELSGNGLFALAAAMRRNELDYDKFYLTMPQEQANAILERLGVERLPLTSALQVQPDDPATDVTPFRRRPRNVVLVSVESLSASFLGAYGDRRGLTPELDRLAAAGLQFDQVYATGTRTVRGLEALSLATPPVPGQAVVRRPGNENLTTLGGILGRQGVTPLFLYGGYGYFDNMNAYFEANGYRVHDRTDFPAQSGQFANVWGVADEVLYDQALILLDREHAAGKPFFAHIMTTSNHRPYTYPDGRIDIPSPGGRDGAVKYTDWAIGKFLRDARSKPWFAETLFVIIADHCASVAGKSRLPVENYHIPLIMVAPALLKPGHITARISQIDLAPTLIEVLGKNGDDHFFGRSVFDATPPVGRLFVSNYQELGYLSGDVLTVLMTQRRVMAYRVTPEGRTGAPIPVDPVLRDEAIAWYQTAARAFKSGALKDRQKL